MQALKDLYTKRQEDFKAAAAAYRSKYNRFALVRLVFFLLASAVAIGLGSYSFPLAAGFYLLFLGIFYRFMKWHLGIKKAEKHHKGLALVNQHEMLALDYKTAQFGDGKDLIDPSHAYSLDLDLFGPYSFFQYCNRASSYLGRRKLAEYLQQPASALEIKQRQAAIEELSGMLDWRQNLQVHGLETEDSPLHVQALKSWLDEAPFLLEHTFYKIAMYVVPFWSLFTLIFILPNQPWYLSLLCFLPAAYILNKSLKDINRIHNHTAQAGDMLAKYAFVIRHIEEQEFQSEKLQVLKKTFFRGDTSASKALNHLAYTISQLNVRYNAFAILLNISGLWDFHWVLRLEKWKLQYKERLMEWFESMQAFEALVSLSTVHFNNPDWTFPTIAKEPLLVADELGHPLIHPDTRISNDFTTPLSGHIKLVTGSNMAGKSTFLRTVGLNIVLAMAGAPVCARRLSLPLIQVYTSMRTQDALHESTSSFFAELKRLKFIIDEVEQPNDPTFHPYFLLDEILKGTNSKDRHTGGEALIRQMIKAGGAGIIATHDLELGKLEAEYDGQQIENLCMEVEIDNGVLDFDYKLKKGVSQSFNATILMQSMGIKIP
ncbi:MAG: hypothetical protein AAF990_18045 [Bacteroidota bacterium]